MPSPWKVSPSPRRSDSISLVNCRSTDFVKEFVPPGGVLNDFGAVERRAEHRRVRVLAAKAAADAAVDHRRHRVAAQRVGVVLDGEGRAAGEADAGVIAGAGVLVDAVFDADVPLAFRQFLGYLRTELALPFQLALALGNDDLESLVIRGHRLLER